MPTDNNSTTHTSNKQVYYNEHIAILTSSGGGYTKLNDAHVLYLKGDGSAALILGRIIRFALWKKEDETYENMMIDNDCWFLCQSSYLQYKTGMPKQKLHRIITLLTELNLIEIEYRFQRRMWIRINHKRLREVESLVQRSKNFDDGDDGRESMQWDRNDPTSGTEIIPLVERKSSHSYIEKNNREEKREEPAFAGNSSSKTNKERLQRSKINTPNSVSKYTEVFIQEVNYQLHEINGLRGSVDPTWRFALRSALKGKKYLTSQITAALNLVKETFADPTSPVSKPTNPTHFIKALPGLLRAVNEREEEQLQEEESAPSQETIDSVLRGCADITFPDRKALLSLVKQSCSNFSTFLTKFRKVKDRLASGKLKLSEENQDDLRRFVEYASVEVSYGVDYEIEKWLHIVYKHTVEWDDWDGNLKRNVWSLQNKWIKKRMLKWSMESTDSSRGYEVFIGVYS